MKADKYRIDGTKKCHLEELPTDSSRDDVTKAGILGKFEKNLAEMSELQNRFYACKKEGIILVLQALDAAGKDSLIRHAVSGMNPQGVRVTCFKRPSEEELSHDYLWRVNKALPARGEIAVFNRSYYEDVITAKVLHLKDTYQMSERILSQSEEDFIDRRIRQVKNYEQYLYENSYRVVKVFLHVSKDEQRERFLERIDREDKNWKFESGDLDTREKFDEYMKTFDEVISKTASKEAPWYAIPADDKWYTRYLLTEILLDVMKATKPSYPEMPAQEKEKLLQCKTTLLSEKGISPDLVEKEEATKISGTGKPDPAKYIDLNKNGRNDYTESGGLKTPAGAAKQKKEDGKHSKDKEEKRDKGNRKEKKDKKNRNEKKNKKDRKGKDAAGGYEKITDID